MEQATQEQAPAAMISIRPEIEALEHIYDVLNEKLYGGLLPRPVISITPRASRKKTLGWCTSRPVWSNADAVREVLDKAKETGAGDAFVKPTHFEISVVAEHLFSPILAIVETVAHEMVHHYCGINEIQDTSRGCTYHNKRFRDEAEEHGLKVEYHKQMGWAITAPNSFLIEIVEMFLNDVKIGLFRAVPQGSKSTSKKPYKYRCPVCQKKFDSRKQINATCNHETDDFAFFGTMPPPCPFKCIFDPTKEDLPESDDQED